jgi:hypothetical protein
MIGMKNLLAPMGPVKNTVYRGKQNRVNLMNNPSFLSDKNFKINISLNKLNTKSMTNRIPKGFKIESKIRLAALSLFVS